MIKSSILKIGSNYVARVWSLVSVFIFIPIYIKYLGIESYAVIGFYSLLLGLVGFVDSGMSSAVLKEFSLDNGINYKYSILRKVEQRYIAICGILILLFISFSGFISRNWISSEVIPVHQLHYYIILIGVGISFQLLSSLYYGAYFGLNEQLNANLYQVIWSIAKSLLVVVFFIFVNASLEFYFWWQIICNLIYVLVLRFSVIKKLKQELEKLVIIIDKIPRHIYSFIINVSFIAILTSLNGYADKIIASSLFTLSEFGFYNIASTISQLPMYVSSPLILFIFPLIAKFYHNRNFFRLNFVIYKIYFLLIIIIFPILFTIILFNRDIMLIWSGRTLTPETVKSYGTLITLLVLGYFFSAMQLPMYYILLAANKTKFSVTVNVVQFLLGIPLLYIFAKKFGISYIGIIWLVLAISSFLAIFIYSNKIGVIKINFKKAILELIGLPLCLNILTFGLFNYLYVQFSFNFIWIIFMSFFLSVLFNIIVNNYIHGRNPFNILNLFRFPG